VYQVSTKEAMRFKEHTYTFSTISFIDGKMHS